MARLNLTRPGIGLAIVSLALAACGHSGGGSTPSGTPSPSPGVTTSPGVLSSPCAPAVGQAYEPDNGNGLGFTGVQVARFQDTSLQLCSNVPVKPGTTNFQASVGGLAFAPDQGSGLSVAIALLLGPGGYRYAQDVFQADIGQIVPIGSAYDLATQPTPLPSATPNPNATAALIADASSVSVIGSFAQAVALITGPSAPSIVALTSLTNAPPQYGSSVPFAGTNYTLKPGIPPDNYSVIRTNEAATVALVRGVNHLVSFGITQVSSGYQFDAKAQDPNLGFGTPLLRGYGGVSIDPVDQTRALVAKGNVLTLVTGLPNAITETAHLVIPGTTIRAVRIAATGQVAAVATDVGLSIVTGIGGTTLAVLPAFTTTSVPNANQIPFVNCAGQTTTLSNVYGVGFSSSAQPGTTNDYLVVLGSSNPAPPAGTGSCTYPAAVVALPIDPATGVTPAPTSSPVGTATASPAPRQFTQNNMIAPPAGVDDFFVH